MWCVDDSACFRAYRVPNGNSADFPRSWVNETWVDVSVTPRPWGETGPGSTWRPRSADPSRCAPSVRTVAAEGQPVL